mgnify:CR=1 FL=1
MVMMLASTPVIAGLLEDFLRAADKGECIEDVTYRMVEHRGATHATEVVAAALSALAARTEQQRSLCCDGAIAAQAMRMTSGSRTPGARQKRPISTIGAGKSASAESS